MDRNSWQSRQYCLRISDNSLGSVATAHLYQPEKPFEARGQPVELPHVFNASTRKSTNCRVRFGKFRAAGNRACTAIGGGCQSLSTGIRRPAAIASARSEEHTSELQSLMRISYAVFCLKKKTKKTT